MPTYTVTPNSCTDVPTLTVHPKSDTNAAVPSYITVANDAGTFKLNVRSTAGADVAAETEYVVKATAPGGTIVDTSVEFKLTVKLACITSFTITTNTITDIVYYINTAAATPLQFDLPTYAAVPAACDEPLMASIFVGSDATRLVALPSWFTRLSQT